MRIVIYMIIPNTKINLAIDYVVRYISEFGDKQYCHTQRGVTIGLYAYDFQLEFSKVFQLDMESTVPGFFASYY